MIHNECYGKLFPTVNSPPTDRSVRGKAFEIELRRAGGMAIAARQASVDADEWDHCVACDEFANCYKLSIAKLALEIGVMAN
jgi:hypothetical protein